MKLTFIGTGSAFTVGQGNYHSNMILETGSHKKLLIDCGSDARLALDDLNLSYKDIHSVYISHLHADHCGGLEWLAFRKKFASPSSKPNLYLHPALKECLWKILSVSLNPFQDEKIELSTFFDVHEIENHQFFWEQHDIKIFQTVHIKKDSKLMPCYGLVVKGDEQTFLITTDTQFTPEVLLPLYQEVDVIFQDCEISSERSGVHAHYTELKGLSPEIKNKMWLYHYQPLPLPDARADGFRGFVKKGQSFEL
jgi:ribonuclease BN (tRNA processing enzyme)